MLQKFFATAFACAAFMPLMAQETETTIEKEKKSTTTLSGFADVYYRYSFNKSTDVDKTSFTNSHNSFELGMVSAKVEHSWSKVGLVADIGFGKRAEDFNYADENTRLAIKQLNVSYSPKEWLKFVAGTWGTHIGYELADANLNRNYSMSYLFSKGPFQHTGLKAEATTGKHSFMLGITNPTDLKSAPMDSKKFVIGQYGLAASEATQLYVSFVAGEDDPTFDSKTWQVDAVVTQSVSDKFSIGLNGSVNGNKYTDVITSKDVKGKWWGTALYLNFDPLEKLGFTLRGEYFDDKDGRTGMFTDYGFTGGNIFATTLSANIKIQSLTIIPEIRIDNASESIFDKKSGTSKSSGHFLVAAVYQF